MTFMFGNVTSECSFNENVNIFCRKLCNVCEWEKFEKKNSTVYHSRAEKL